MNILYCGDRNTERGILLSLLSIIKHTAAPLEVHLITATIPTEKKAYLPISNAFVYRLEEVLCEVNSSSSVFLHDVTRLFREQPPRANLATHFTPCCMLRLYADLVTNIPSKVLYLDYDVVANAPIDGLWETDVSDVEFAGVLDYYGSWFFRKDIRHADYMNSGVLLLNMERIRETGLFAKCRERCARVRMFMPDQSALNKLAERKMELPRRFNEQRELQDDTVLQHFSTSFRLFPVVHIVSVKPWQQERMHKILKLHAYDDILETYSRLGHTFEFIGDI